MPWTYDDPPSVAQNWTTEQQHKCVDAANSALAGGADDEAAIFACIRAAGRSTEMTAQGFLFTELAVNSLTPGRPFDGVAFGTFRDMHGREITLEADDAADFVANTQAAIERTRSESGELVGLPIDAQGHDKGDGAGWIVGADLVDGVVRLVPKWTEIGRDLIGKGIRRFFSATIDITNKVILGGTLTNWPATRDENNRLMLRPIELSEQMYTMEANMADENVELEQEVTPSAETQPAEPAATAPAAPPPEVEPATPATPIDPAVSAELVREFTQAGDLDVVQLVENVQRKAAELARLEMEKQLSNRQRQWEITNLSAQYVGGGKYGLPVKTDELARFLDSLNTEQFEMATDLFERITDGGLVEFQERGHARKLRQKQLPEVYHGPLRDTIAAGNSVDEFFELTGIGSPEDYDLSLFKDGA